MKHALTILMMIGLVACSQPETTNRGTVVIGEKKAASVRGELMPQAPKVLLDGSGKDVQVVEMLSSIVGRYYTQSGGSLTISDQGDVAARDMLGAATKKGLVQLGSTGSLIRWETGETSGLSRVWLGLSVGSETVLREDGRVMFDLPVDQRLVGRFVAGDGQVLISQDGRVFDHVALQDGLPRVRRFLHYGVYLNQEDSQRVPLRFLDQVGTSEQLVAELPSNGGLRVGGVVFQSVGAESNEPLAEGSYQDTHGNRVSVDPRGVADFTLSFPGKANAIKATGKAMAISPSMFLVESREVGAAFSFVARKLAMGHLIVSLPASYGSAPLLLMAKLDQRTNPTTVAPLGLYLNPDAYDITLTPDNKLSMGRKTQSGTRGTPGAIARQVIGVEMYAQGVAKVYYDQGDPLLSLFEETQTGSLSFYPTDYRKHAVYHSDLGDAHRMHIAMPEDGLRREKVPTLTLDTVKLRHYQTAYPDLLSKAFEEQQSKQDLALSEKLQQDPKVQLSAEEAQAERERRARRRHVARNDGNPTPNIGEFFVSKHQARVNEMLSLRKQLEALPVPRNASELRANIEKDKRIRHRAAELERQETNDAGAP